ncbi:MAG: hypothetical protein CM1200mP2_33950 [Planctomycetaceae bacterium]|nr:MAG: hypothetical protein CM1200mP2_33950 [Planctomycetaceae bacterium]
MIRDRHGRVYPNPGPSPGPGLLFPQPDLPAHGESVHLPPGEYSVEVSRGPEYVVQTRKLVVPGGVVSHKVDFRLTRWTHPASRPGSPVTITSTPPVVRITTVRPKGQTGRHDATHPLAKTSSWLCLSWGPCWYSQKQYFEGRTSALSRPQYLMRYDVEVSGFPSSHAGHLCLLRLSEDDYPGTKLIEEWPSWTFPGFSTGESSRGGWSVTATVAGGWPCPTTRLRANGSSSTTDACRQVGKGRAADKLPDYAMPPFDGIGANEFIVTVAHDVCHFISAVDTPSVWELNIWYHTLNWGSVLGSAGRPIFPCIYGDKVGLGRIYVKLDKDPPLTFDNWIAGVRDGPSYFGTAGRTSLTFGWTSGVGEPGADKAISQLNLDKPGRSRSGLMWPRDWSRNRPTSPSRSVAGVSTRNPTGTLSDPGSETVARCPWK